MDFFGAKDYIVGRFERELSPNLFYHGIHHTFDVLNAVNIYGDLEKINEKELVLLKTAALFHDSGFLIKYECNEGNAVDIVKEILPRFGYSKKQIVLVSEMIISTIIPQNPKNLLEQILCDADLDYLGRDDFFMLGISLHREWLEQGLVVSLKEWYEMQKKFLMRHNYFTKSAINLRQEKKMHHFHQIMELLDGK